MAIFLEPLKLQMQYTYHNLTEANTDEKLVLAKKLSEVKSKLFKVEERFVYGEIEREVYINVSGKLRTEMDNFEGALQSVNQNFSNPGRLIGYAIKLCGKLGDSWEKGKLYQKTDLQNLLFPMGFCTTAE